MELKVQKAEQGPVLAAKGDIGVGSAGGTTGVTVETGNGGTVAVGGNANNGGTAGVGYTCKF
jgi:hypothetical protein